MSQAKKEGTQTLDRLRFLYTTRYEPTHYARTDDVCLILLWTREGGGGGWISLSTAQKRGHKITFWLSQSQQQLRVRRLLLYRAVDVATLMFDLCTLVLYVAALMRLMSAKKIPGTWYLVRNVGCICPNCIHLFAYSHMNTHARTTTTPFVAFTKRRP